MVFSSNISSLSYFLLLRRLSLRLTGRTFDLLQFTFNFRNHKTFRMSGRGIGATYNHYLHWATNKKKCIIVPIIWVGFESTIPEFTCAFCDRLLSSFSTTRLSAFLIFPDRPACRYLILLPCRPTLILPDSQVLKSSLLLSTRRP
jgi:hypothetical protein